MQGFESFIQKSKHHLIGLGFWQAWQMLMFCTDVVAPSGVGGDAGLKTVALTATSLGYVAVLLAYMVRPAVTESRRSLSVAGATTTLGTFLMMLVPYITDAQLQSFALAVSACTMAWGNASLLLMWGELWKTLATGRVGQHLYWSYTFAFVLFFVGVALPHPFDGVYASLMPVFSVAVLASCKDEPRRRPTLHPLHLGKTPIVRLFVVVFILSIIWGASQRVALYVNELTNSSDYLVASMVVAGLAIAVFALFLAINSPANESLALFEPIAPIIAAGVVALALLPQNLAFVGNGLLTAGVYCLDMFFMLTATDIAYRSCTSATLVFGGAVVSARLGTTIGTFCTIAVANSFGGTLQTNVVLMLAVASLGVVVLACSLLFTKADLLTLYSTDGHGVAAGSLVPSGDAETESTEVSNDGMAVDDAMGGAKDVLVREANCESADKPSELEGQGAPVSLDERCAIVADKMGLTARETEVLNLLVRGRTVQDVCDELVIARGTAKHHVSNIYRKLGVGDRRSLYDIVEGV